MHLVECDGELELVVEVGRQLESKITLSIDLQELSKLAVEALWDLRQQRAGLVHLLLEHADLKVHHRQKKSVRVDVQVLVDEI